MCKANKYRISSALILHDKSEYLSSGRTLDYEETLFLTKGNHSTPIEVMLCFEMVEDTVGRHDFLLAPCSAEMFRITYGAYGSSSGLFWKFKQALSEFGIHG